MFNYFAETEDWSTIFLYCFVIDTAAELHHPSCDITVHHSAILSLCSRWNTYLLGTFWPFSEKHCYEHIDVSSPHFCDISSGFDIRWNSSVHLLWRCDENNILNIQRIDVFSRCKNINERKCHCVNYIGTGLYHCMIVEYKERSNDIAGCVLNFTSCPNKGLPNRLAAFYFFNG